MAEKVLRFVMKLAGVIFLVLLMVYLFRETRNIGYSMFADRPYDSSQNAAETVLTVTEGESLVEIGKELQKAGVVKNAYIFALSIRAMEGYDKIQPGEYLVNAAQKPSEILAELTKEGTGE